MGSQRVVLGVVAVLAAVAASCVLLVDPPDGLGRSCRFAGAETACGQCLASSCRAEVDACCGSAPCATQIDDCASGACASARTDTRSWASCAISRCADACGLGAANDDGGDPTADASSDAKPDAPPKPTTTSCATIGEGCTCKVGAPPNPVVCSQATVAHGRCCAASGWPSSGTCTCDPITCEINSFGCECGLVTDGPLSECVPTGTRSICCARGNGLGTCICSNKLCTSADGDEVASCTGPTTPCPGTQRAVTSCSF